MKPDPETLRTNAQGTIPAQAFTGEASGFFSKTYLSGKSVYERLANGETIQYLLVNGSKGLNITQAESATLETYTPDGGLRSLTAVTDQRVFFVIGRRDSDLFFQIDRDDITDATLRSGLLSTKVDIETARATYTFRVNKRASSDPSDAVEYVKTSLVPKQSSSPDGKDEAITDAGSKSDTTHKDSTNTIGRADGGPPPVRQTADSAESSGPSRADLIEDLRQVQERIGEQPSFVDVLKYGKYRRDELFKEFSTWDAAIEAAFPDSNKESGATDTSDTGSDDSRNDSDSERGNGTEPTTPEPTRDEFIEELERVSEKLGKRPTMEEFDSYSRLYSSDVYDYFDGWGDAVDAASIEVASRQELLDELRRLESELGYPPFSRHIDERSEFSTHDYQLEFGSLDDAHKIAGLDPKARFVETLRDVVARADGKPTMAEFVAATPYSQGIIYKYFNSWDAAVAATQDIEDDTSDDGDTETAEVEQNELSEQYELLRNLQTLVTAIVEAHEEDGSNLTKDPMVEWASTVDDFWRNGRTDAGGYGEQQNERNPFSMREYRAAFGNGERVTEFEHTPASPLTPSLKVLFNPLVDADLDTFYLPSDADSQSPLPVIVESTDELQRAMKKLEQFPSEPAPAAQTEPPGEGESGSTISDPLLPDNPLTPGKIESKLTDVNGVTDDAAQRLQAAGYSTEADLRGADMDELAAVAGIGEQLAMRIKLDVGE